MCRQYQYHTLCHTRVCPTVLGRKKRNAYCRAALAARRLGACDLGLETQEPFRIRDTRARCHRCKQLARVAISSAVAENRRRKKKKKKKKREETREEGEEEEELFVVKTPEKDQGTQHGDNYESRGLPPSYFFFGSPDLCADPNPYGFPGATRETPESSIADEFAKLRSR
ncbi:hypothetical protein AAE478_004762 [Parahypoxylon ruwenzoriense]